MEAHLHAWQAFLHDQRIARALAHPSWVRQCVSYKAHEQTKTKHMNETLTEEQETERGLEIVRVLQLKPAKDSNRKRWNPDRYETTHGNKTALGIFRTLEHLITKGI
jgi:hypothetical protein